MDRHVSVTNIRKWSLVVVALILLTYVQISTSAPCGCCGCGSCCGCNGCGCGGCC
ncbi:Uncharacterized protein FWK35_00026748 [Aphis craccivora]|uniref:Uncharacterized protein n=1 Tax=Aphis craccivora TaxID=307492 RepID=A0A6G0ZBU3_APHCR|nr:Uncharacterized protein FWK35_00026748 [Aphis craccivora]